MSMSESLSQDSLEVVKGADGAENQNADVSPPKKVAEEDDCDYDSDEVDSAKQIQTTAEAVPNEQLQQLSPEEIKQKEIEDARKMLNDNIGELERKIQSLEAKGYLYPLDQRLPESDFENQSEDSLLKDDDDVTESNTIRNDKSVAGMTHDIMTGSLLEGIPSDSSPIHPMASSTVNRTSEEQKLDNEYGQADTTFRNARNIDEAHNTSYEVKGPSLTITNQEPEEGHPYIETDRNFQKISAQEYGLASDVVELKNDETISGGQDAQQLQLNLQDSYVGPETVINDQDQAAEEPRMQERPENPAEIPGFKNLPLNVQGQLRALAKPSRERTTKDIAKLKLSMKEVEFFKNLSHILDEKTWEAIIRRAEYTHCDKGRWVYKKGDRGELLYIVLHGNCQLNEPNEEYIEYRRGVVDQLKKLYEEYDKELDIEKQLKKMRTETPKHDEMLQRKLRNLKRLLKQRRDLQKAVEHLQQLGKYHVMNEWTVGASFGEDALMFNTPRTASVKANKHSFFLVVKKEDFQNYLERAMKKQNQQVLEFFKNVPFLSGLSNQSIQKMAYQFEKKEFKTAGQYVLREGDEVKYVAVVKEGEFDIVKKNLRGIDSKLLEFLKKGDVRKRIANKVLLLPGRTSIYQKTNQLIPPYEKTIDNSFMSDKSLDIEQLAFNSVKEQLFDIAEKQAHAAGQKQNNSLNALKTSSMDRYKDIRISIQGSGYVFGEIDVYTNQPTYQYSLRANKSGGVVYLMEKKYFMKYVENYVTLREAIRNSYHTKDLEMMRQLTRTVFNKWYTDLLQENLKVVPDLDPTPSNDKRSASKPAGGAVQDQKASPKKRSTSEAQTSGAPGSQKHVKNKASLGVKRLSAEEIIQQSGKKHDVDMINLRQQDEQKLQEEAAAAKTPTQQQYRPPQPNPEANKGLPKEKLQSQLNTIMPMEIVRAQPFFSRHSHILRDQIDEYVHGFPATRVHRQIIAKAYDMDETALIQEIQKKAAIPQMEEENVSPKQKQSQTEPEEDDKSGILDSLYQQQGDMPVDPKRLRKAIKNALIKNDNNPDKIDIQNIMREQVKIHKHIQDFRQSRRKQNDTHVNNNYFSSRIVKKIAEDHVCHSIKQIQNDHTTSTGEFIPPQSMQKQAPPQSKSVENLQPTPTKFQKLLASKYNQGFKSVLKDFYRQNSPSNKNTNRSTSQIKIQEKNNDKPGSAQPMESDRKMSIQHSEEDIENQREQRYNHISHKKIGLKQEVTNEVKAQYGSTHVMPMPKVMNQSYDSGLPSSAERTDYTFFSNSWIAAKHKVQGSPAYKADSILYKSKQHLAQQTSSRRHPNARLAGNQSMLGHSKGGVALPGTSHAPSMSQRLTDINDIHGRSLPTKSFDGKRGSSLNQPNQFIHREKKKLLDNYTLERIQQQMKQGGKDKRIRLAALFQPKVKESSQLREESYSSTSNYANMKNGYNSSLMMTNFQTSVGGSKNGRQSQPSSVSVLTAPISVSQTPMPPQK